MIADPKVDAVAIATPVASHFDLVRRALEAGKHVFVEKPLAASGAEAAELVSLAEQLGLVLMVGHTFLYSPPVNRIREILRGSTSKMVFFSGARDVDYETTMRFLDLARSSGAKNIGIIVEDPMASGAAQAIGQ